MVIAHAKDLSVLLVAAVLLTSCSRSPHENESPRRQSTRDENGDAVSYVMINVPGTTTSFPRLTSFRDSSVMKRVNDQLDQETRKFKCEDDSNPKTEFMVQASVTYAARDIFSIDASASYNCGGPYPTNDADMSMTFDLKTGNRVELEDLFDGYSTDKRKILEMAFANQIEHTAKLLAAKTEDDGSCEKNTDLYTVDNLAGSSFSFSFAPAGLQMKPQWPHVVEVCAERVTVPYKMLSPFARASGLLARVQ